MIFHFSRCCEHDSSFQALENQRDVVTTDLLANLLPKQ
jgi:hypothetical protein